MGDLTKNTPFYNFAKGLLPIIFKPLYFYKVKNKNSLPQGQGCVVCCNHISMKDPVFLGLAQKRMLRYMAKSELFQNKFVSKIISALGAFPIQRGKHDEGAINLAEEYLKQGAVVGIFIEGTRSKDGNLLKPKSGAAMLAYKAQVPVMPVSISTKGGGLLKLFHRVTISCGQTVTPEELGITEGTGPQFREASRKIMELISALRQQDI